jgi:hypothetical protein
MISKLLFTAAVIALVYLLAKGRAERARTVRRAEPPAAAALPRPSDRTARWLAYGLLGVMLAGSALFVFLQWQDQYRVVTVRVVNANTGRSVSYQARRGDVGERSFQTLDGRRVVLASVERMELGAP